MSDERDDGLLRDYRALLEKVSAKFDEVHARERAHMACGKGCSNCCAPGLTVFAIERENIRRFLLAHPEILEAARRLEATNPHQGARCTFLDEQGACRIYDVRPVICRSHGAPIFSKATGSALLDVCPLNFTDVSGLAELDSKTFINIDLLNQLLALVNAQFVKANEQSGAQADALKRFVLTPSGILSGDT